MPDPLSYPYEAPLEKNLQTKMSPLMDQQIQNVLKQQILVKNQVKFGFFFFFFVYQVSGAETRRFSNASPQSEASEPIHDFPKVSSYKPPMNLFSKRTLW